MTKTVSAGVVAVLASLLGGSAGNDAPHLLVPDGFVASVYARDLPGARALAIEPDGTLTLRGRRDTYEILPPRDDQPVTVMRVATELDDLDDAAAENATLAVSVPGFVHLSWHADSSEIAYTVASGAGAGIPVPPRTLALARTLASARFTDVALAPDGTLFVADPRRGTVWQIRPANPPRT
ncbi:MAG TPA: hypothetical protein VMF52_08950 [Steroidobacteraceae bacterium]|nr:hypothetical protein [Steroidobacteraceae bacterium]